MMMGDAMAGLDAALRVFCSCRLVAGYLAELADYYRLAAGGNLYGADADVYTVIREVVTGA